jgi:GntR family transcriptional repressor for pyruvate dehydrogenase complex
MTGLTTTFTNRADLAVRIEDELLLGTPPGTRLPSERELAVRFKVSRPLVREALRTLAERGLVEVSPGRGLFTRDVQAVDIARPLDSLFRRRQATARQLVEARLMLEGETASLAAGRAGPADLSAMAAALEHFDSAPGPLEKARYDVTFHSLVARAAHNPVVEAMFTAITPLVFELMVRSLADPGVASEGSRFHRDILAGVTSGNAAAAREAMTAHIALALSRYGEDLDRSVEALAQREIRRLLGPWATVEGILETIQRFGQGNEESVTEAADAAEPAPPARARPRRRSRAAPPGDP